MLVLPIKKKWFDMICSGEKREEYREIKPYYNSRLPADFGYFVNGNVLEPGKVYDTETKREKEAPHEAEVVFRNGYGKVVPSIRCVCVLRTGTGKEEWGAEKGKEYYILEIKKIIERSGMNG